MDSADVIGATRLWLERAVIGLHLCPFAASVYAGGRVRFQVSEQTSNHGLLEQLRAELLWLQAQDARLWETTLLIHPCALTDFLAYNDFLSDCDAMLADLDLEGELQIASFHPQYQFAGTRPDDIENYTNRSPFPMLHLLREESIERALGGLSDGDEIYRRNIRTLRGLGIEGWRRLWEGAA
ncbi:MAG: DUF1415 domain-containing protein [Steroidobacteraceae bacterium]|jgi:hypothetical protein